MDGPIASTSRLATRLDNEDLVHVQSSSSSAVSAAPQAPSASPDSQPVPPRISRSRSRKSRSEHSTGSWVSEQDEQSSTTNTDSSDESRTSRTHMNTPVKSQLSRLNGGLRKTRSKLSLSSSNKSATPASAAAASTTPTNKIGSFFSSVLSPSSQNSSPLRSPTAKRAGTSSNSSNNYAQMYSRAVNYLFDSEAVNDDPAHDLWIMGNRYKNEQAGEWPADFVHDFVSTIACTYRTQFEPIPCVPSGMAGMLNSLSITIGRQPREGLSSDTGWGCMLRTGQSLLANALLHLHLGRQPGVVRNTSQPPAALDPTYARLVSLFLDSPSPMCPFSIHRFALKGKQLGKEVGEWFGPSTAAGAIQSLVNEYEPAGMRVVNFVDGSIYESRVKEASRNWSVPVLVVMGLRLGINGINPIYHKAVLSLFELPQCVGIAGGRPSSSFYFIGSQGDSLFYIDPHHSKPAVTVPSASSEVTNLAKTLPLSASSQSQSQSQSKDDVEAARDKLSQYYIDSYDSTSFESYHVSRIRKTSIHSLDPSMLLGFLIRSEQDWTSFKESTIEKGIVSTVSTSSSQSSASAKSSGIFVVQEREPAWMTMSDASLSVPTSTSKKASNRNAKKRNDRKHSMEYDDLSLSTDEAETTDMVDSGQEEQEEEDDEDDDDGFEDLGKEEIASPVLFASTSSKPLQHTNGTDDRRLVDSAREQTTIHATDRDFDISQTEGQSSDSWADSTSHSHSLSREISPLPTVAAEGKRPSPETIRSDNEDVVMIGHVKDSGDRPLSQATDDHDLVVVYDASAHHINNKASRA